jgi:hypothetical protein
MMLSSSVLRFSPRVLGLWQSLGLSPLRAGPPCLDRPRALEIRKNLKKEKEEEEKSKEDKVSFFLFLSYCIPLSCPCKSFAI